MKPSNENTIAFFDEATNRYYKFITTQDWPTVTISRVPMHRLISPKQDTLNKLQLLKPYGVVLDTCLGLGYTAISMARVKRVSKVYSFEKDSNMLEIAKQNQYSKELFASEKITYTLADTFLEIKKFPDLYFDCILHDPPTFKIAPELFTQSFYEQLYRVLKVGGRLFHYTPQYKKTHGYDFPSKIKTKLKLTGFRILEMNVELGGIVCTR